MTDQVVFEVKDKAKKIERWVRNTLSGATEVEVKVKEATSNDKWGPTGTQMQEIAQASHSFEHFDTIMKTLWIRLNDNGKYWRHVYKGLLLLEYLIKNGSDQVVRACQSNGRQIQTLTKFQFITPNGKDEGENIRNRAKQIVELLSDDNRIKEERKRAAETRRRFEQSMSSEGGSGYGGSGYGNDEYSNYSRGNYGGESYRTSNQERNYNQDKRPNSNNNNNNDDDDEGFDSSEENIKKNSLENNKNITTTVTTTTTEKKPRPPSTELKKEAIPQSTQQSKPQFSLIDLFDNPTPNTGFQGTPNTGFGGYQTPNTGFGGFQGTTTTPNTGFGGFQGTTTTTPNTGFGGFQGTTTPNTGFGGFQGTTTPNTGFGGFQGTTTTTPNTGFGGFQGTTNPGFGVSPPNTNFGTFQSGNNDDFDNFNPRGNSSSNQFANFDNPNPKQEEKKGIWGETSNLVNLTNLIEDPNDNKNPNQEKKTLGQTLQQKQGNKPVMVGGTLNPTVNPLSNGMNPLTGMNMVPQQPVFNVQSLSLQQIQQLSQQQIQLLNPQQLQLLQLHYQQLLLQQNQGGRGF